MNGISSAEESVLTTTVASSMASIMETTPTSGSTVESAQAVSSGAQSDSSQMNVITSSDIVEPLSALVTDTSSQPSSTSTGGTDN